MAKQTFTTGQVLTAAQVNSLQSNDFNQTVSAKTAAYTLVAADKGTRIEFNTSGSVACTVNTGLFDAGDTLVIQNRGAGVVTVTAGTATVNTSATLALSQYDAGTLYFISASAAIFFNTDAGGGSPLTTKGDLYGFSTVDARIPIGANNTVLTADSAESFGLKWAAPTVNVGGYTLLNAGGTALTGATSVTVSSLSGYNDMFIYIDGVSSANGNSTITVQFNSSATNHNARAARIISASTYGAGNFDGNTLTNGDKIKVLRTPTSATTIQSAFMKVEGANSTAVKPLWFVGYSDTGGTSDGWHLWGGGYFDAAAVISSVTIGSGTGPLDAGTVYIYGRA